MLVTTKEETRLAFAVQVEGPPQAWQPAQAQTGADSLEMANQAELSIIQQVLAGNRQAFNQLVIAYQGLAYRVAYRILRRKDLVADAVQEAFLKAYRALLTFRGEHFKSWLMRIVVNICYDLLRVCRRQATASLDALSIAPEYVRSLTDPAERPEAYVERMELRQRIEVGLCALPPEQQAAVVLCDIHGYSYAEMADMMGVAMGTVKSRLARGRSRLAAYLLEHELLS